MTITEQIITIAVVVFAVQLCRWLPFWLFPAYRPIPNYIQYLGYALPPAIFGLLVVYCFKQVDIFSSYHGAAEFIAGGFVIMLHLWRRNMFLSIFAGTALYMILVQKVFI